MRVSVPTVLVLIAFERVTRSRAATLQYSLALEVMFQQIKIAFAHRRWHFILVTKASTDENYEPKTNFPDEPRRIARTIDRGLPHTNGR